MSTPAIRAIVLLALTLLVTRVDADDPDRTVPAEYLALVARLLDRRSNFHVQVPSYLYRYVMRPRLRSYGVSSTCTRSPGAMRMKCMRIFPEMWASTLCPFSNSTRNMALGSGSTTVPSTRIVSSFGLARTLHLLHAGRAEMRAKTF